MIRGPLEYVPPVEVDVVAKRKAMPLDENEGIYVRDIKTGKVGVCGCVWVCGWVGTCVRLRVCAPLLCIVRMYKYISYIFSPSP